MTEWLVEEGVGETRAALVVDGAIVEARIEREAGALRHDDVVEGRVGKPASGGRTRLAIGGEDALLRGPAGAPEGASVRVRIVREAIPERGNPKPAEARLALAEEEIGRAPPLADRLGAGPVPVRRLAAHEPDRLEEAGWGELIDGAMTGDIAFDGGLLRIALTPAMTVIDVDGDGPAAELALSGAAAAARAIRRLDIGGSIGIDLPSVADRAARQRAAAAIDGELPPPFERTAVNGFGFVQIVRPRLRASLPELLQADAALTAALALIRAAERGRMPGGATLVAAPVVIARIERRPEWSATLARRIGGPVALRREERLAISASYVEAYRQS